MKKLVIVLLKIFSLLFGLFLVAAFLVAVFVDINHYKNNIEGLVQSNTGLKLTIAGDLDLSIFSGLQLSAKDVKLADDKALIADIEFLDLELDAWSLYYGVPEISGLELKVREFNLARDKHGNFNILPLSADNKAQPGPERPADANSTVPSDQVNFPNLSIHDIDLKLARFSYLDDLDSVSVKLDDVQASLSLLPIIDNNELVLDDPRVLVNYSYSGKLSVKQALSNQYQFADVILAFSDQQGDFLIEELAVSFIQQGKEHGLPPIMFDAKGKLQLHLDYQIPEDRSEPLWQQPQAITMTKVDLELPELSWRNADYEILAENSHLSLAEIPLVAGRQYLLDEWLIQSMVLDSEKIQLKTLADEKAYHLKNVLLQVNHLPVFHQGKPLQWISEVFLRQFAQQGRLHLVIDDIVDQEQGLNNIEVLLEARDKGIALSTMSFNALESRLTGNGHISLAEKIPHWRLSLQAPQLNLQPVSNLVPFINSLKGHAYINNQLSGTLHNSDFIIASGKIQVKANNFEVSGMNVDKILTDLAKTQSVGLLDVGAVALLGPAGVVVSKGQDYRNLTSSLENQGNSKIVQLNSDISFANDIATMNDVAFATEQHRLAVHGAIDVKNRLFKNIEVATIDKYGCPIYQEQVTGSLDAPTVKKVNVLVGGVVNPLSSLVAGVIKPVKKPCKKPFYTGSVKHSGDHPSGNTKKLLR